MAVKHLIAGGFMVLALAGCTRASCECGAAPSSPGAVVPVNPAAGFDVLVTDRDQDVTVKAGQRIEVYLRQRGGLTMWTGLRSDDESVLAPVPTGITAARGVTIGGFEAVAPGTASITAYATAACSPGQACPMFAALFSVKVTVV